MARNLAAEYERRFPGTDCSDAQKQERMERIVHKEERRDHRRTNRTRGIVVPRVPWLEQEGGEAA